MLAELEVEHLAVVERARLAFAPGFTAFSGETGAGKSLLLGALGLVLGGRADPDAVRAGEPRARLTARFTLDPGPARDAALALLEAWGIEAPDGEVVLRREIAREGRSRAWVNQVPVTVSALAELAPVLVEVHGQHEQQSLLAPDRQRELLDRWGGLEPRRQELTALHAAWQAARAEREAFARDEARAIEEAGLWADAHDELTRAGLKPGEDQELAARLLRLRHAGRLTAALARARDALAGAEAAAEGEGPAALRGALDLAGEAERAIADAATIDPTLAALREDLHAAALTLAETLRALDEALDPEALDPAEAEAAEARHAFLERLQRKHRRSLDELIAWRDELGERLARMEDRAGTRERLQAAELEAHARLSASARTLGRKRAEAALKLAPQVERELAALGLERARLAIALTPLETPGPSGGERVEFLLAPNSGEEPRPLARIASGGELSRVMLAWKTLLAAQDGVGTLVFDEIDAGIGGAVARAVGERLHVLGRVRQVVCVTHLAVIAAYADHQFAVDKRERDGRTFATATALAGPERVEEIARMLAGDAKSATTTRQARELLRLRDAALERA